MSRQSVPTIVIRKPMNDLSVSFSLNTIYENTTVTTIDNLSIGATTLTSPSCRAL